jgi:serine/threonine-protein kinase HipA
MGRKANSKQLHCHMNGVLVGCLTLRSGRLSFKYAQSWLQHSKARPISLSIPLQSEELKSDSVHAYFDNLLPDSEQVRKTIVDSLGAASSNPFDILSVIGADCIGALSFTEQLPEIDRNLSLMIHSKNLTEVDDAEIADILKRARAGHVLGMRQEDDFRFSLAGAQDKTALTYWQGKWHKPIGATPTTHILKLPIRSSQQMGLDLSSSVENEWFCLRLMKHLGFDVANAAIESFIDQKVLVVERFDRKITNDNIIRLPQEDMCQALGVVSGSKYEEHGGPGIQDIMGLLKTSENTLHDQYLFMKAQMVFWLLAAIDGHAKNFSIFLKPQGYSLTPFYDVMSAYPYFGQGQGVSKISMQKQKIKMAMGLYGKNKHYKWNEVQNRHWFTMSEKVKFPEDEMARLIEELVESVPVAIEKMVKELPKDFPCLVSEAIAEGILNCLQKLSK